MNRFTVISIVSVFMVSAIGSSVFFARGEKTQELAAVSASVLADKTPKYVPGISLPDIYTDNIEASAFIVGTDSGVVLAGRNIASTSPIASLTKIMTALVAERYGKSAVVMLTPRHKSTLPKLSDLPAGETLSLEAAKTLLLVESDNDIAEAIASAVGPLIDSTMEPSRAFIDAMNRMANMIGMASTRLRNPTGLDDPRHYSTAEDIFRLVGYIDRTYPDFWQNTAEPPKEVSALSGKRYKIKSSSLLVPYPGVIGMKTGLTDEALGALIIRYRITEFPEDIIMVILRSPDRFRDGENLMNNVRRAFRTRDLSI